ncbi:glycine--tRNA ligase [Candidatus Woesebacteria bacterium RIFCSPHIGHO2_01_FULL_39_32]|uniref:glycine--tRNA ligase n=1 Tax=Candidatus Woesebacteria bacterium RIFCSPLOWO2_01_FULL_39_25 TaxID=1802521 RepID=A0A1F8BLQ1_9BACT|nr:MAG: glycine--tRNA ligase [Candidatus Woesebacteria bacterium GWB1_37_5]OGM25421.1 MAG: glycine--tRNA ligase [Candidatus Woesebacteria bacterium RIFCSPHIGHO2_01_FULL_39_32]OGM38526.1 MAG: glycine--tRNA ligase [Candidatus Woesebacteria bacterium RIFCSPHIGHO2_12_FULL_38_11]OGM64952.1 MAG: glycine--tRNA ligase [Candidatus Woesebacteria bacterium RIFCSPLOWO2_01_FULL_39_25]
MDLMADVTSLAKRRGFIYPGSEIYGGLAGFWDYGPLGVELKNNIKRQWWKDMVYDRDDVVGIDAAIIMNPEVWKASGHLDAFTDPLVECKICHQRVRADNEEIKKEHEKTHEDKKVEWTEPKSFNLMTEVFLGVTEPKQKAYLRGEITQGVFVNFQNVIDSTRIKLPFGIAQIGKAFRNEITPGNFTFRSREFEQMELEYFMRPDDKEAEKVFGFWKKERMAWYVNLGVKKENLRYRDHDPDERAHYARFATDIEYNSPFGWKEFEGIHHRGDWDLGRHKLIYKDPDTNEEYTPWVIETSGGVDRAALFFLLDAYNEEKSRVILKLHPKLAPFKLAVFPLLANKEELINKAREIHQILSRNYFVAWDSRGNIGKRYFAQDEIGTPWCVTIDFQSLEDDTVTVRDRDTTKQERVSVDKLPEYIENKLG